MSVTNTRLIEVFWKEYVDGFIFHDLEFGARKAEANFLVALGEMCYVDYFGKLMRGKQGSEINFKMFLRSYMPQYTGVLNELYAEVRCGLVHSYFPENVDVIGRVRDPKTPGPAIWREGGRWKIAVVTFAEELKTASNAFKSDLLRGQYINEFKNVILKDPGLHRIPV
ncbi:MAG: hypothetical protein HYU02_01075 [Thaumarchaeota archaeon]|nr:hypothetical protein [Nitrososphaerota archaeon]